MHNYIPLSYMCLLYWLLLIVNYILTCITKTADPSSPCFCVKTFRNATTFPRSFLLKCQISAISAWFPLHQSNVTTPTISISKRLGSKECSQIPEWTKLNGKTPRGCLHVRNFFFKFIWLIYIYFCKNTAWKKFEKYRKIKEQSMWMQ